MSDPEIVVRGRSDLSPITRGLAQVDSGVSRASRGWELFGRAARVGAGLAVAGAAAAGAAAFKLAQGAADDEAGQVRLATALKNSTGARAADVAGVEKWISAQGRALGVADDELRPALAQLAAASGSVATAQRDVSLAMDIAAGREVALSTVTKALERARNGSLSGLTRLGVKTQDAAGETLSLQQITQRLADTYGGQAAAAADTAAGKFGRIQLAASEAGESIGAKLLPVGERFADFVLSKGVPAFDSLWKAAERNGLDGVVRQIEELTDSNGKLTPILDEVRGVAADVSTIFNDGVVPALRDASSVLPVFLSPLKLGAEVLGVLADNADLVRVALTGYVGYLAVLKAAQIASNLAAAQGVSVLRAYGTTAVATGTKTDILASKLRGAAGIAGMGALAAGASASDEKVGILLQTIGGAATGFSVGGPWGALIGGAAGAALGVFGNAAKSSADDAAGAVGPIGTFADSLDQVSGAATSATAKLITLGLQESGALDRARALGISQRDLTQSLLGNAGATKRVNDILYFQRVGFDSTGKVVRYFTEDQEALQDQLFSTRDELKRNEAAVRAQSRATQDFSKVQGKIPRRLFTRIDVEGVAPSVKGIARVVAAGKVVDKKTIKAIINAVGVETTVKKVRGVADELRKTERIKPNLSNYTRSFQSGIQDTEGEAKRGVSQVARTLRDGTKNAKADTAAFKRSLVEAIASGRVTAGEARSIGAQFSLGTAAGISANSGAVQAAARSVISQALAAARAQAKIKSPSRETYYIGDMMGRGAVKGMKDRERDAAKGGRSLIAAALAGVTSGSQGVGKAIDKITRLIEKQIKLKNDKQETAREREVLGSLKDQFEQLTENGRAQDKMNRLIDSARDKYRGLVTSANEYAASVKAGFVSFGSVVGLGENEDGSVSTTSLLDQLQDRLVQAQRFASLIASLRGKLNDTTLKQLIDDGVASSLSTVEAIVAGGSSAVAQINAVTSQIAQSGAGLGSKVSKEFNQAGINAAEAMVQGLERREKRLDRVADRISDRLLTSLDLGAQQRRPKLSDGPNGGQQKLRVELDLSANTITDLQRGRAVRVEGDAIGSVGYRTAAR